MRQPGTPILCRQRHPPRPYHRRLCRHPAASLPPARSIRGRDDSSLAEPARFRRFSFSFGFSPTRTSSTASGRCLAFIPAYRHDGRAATRPSRILYVVKRGLEKFPCPDRVPRPSHVETPPITRHIRRCLLKPQRIRRVAMSYRAQMFSRFLPLSVHASRSNLRGALSAKVSSLPPEAFGLVPPLRDNRLRISVPITILRLHYSISVTLGGWYPFTLPSGLRNARCSPALTLGAVNHLD